MPSKKTIEFEEPGPSDEHSKKDDEKPEEKSVWMRKFSKDKPAKKFQIYEERRRSSSEKAPRRYSLPERYQGPQQSHSLRNLIKKRQESKTKKSQPKLPRSVSKTSVTRDHNDAVESYFKSKGFQRESITNIRGTLAVKTKPSFSLFHRHHHHHKPRKEPPQKDYNITRCKNCMRQLEKCDCASLLQRKVTHSDWMTLIHPKPEDTKIFTNHRIEWLRKIEENSKYDYKEIAANKLSNDREICCFPFKTFRIFSRKDIDLMDYYMKADEKEKSDPKEGNYSKA